MEPKPNDSADLWSSLVKTVQLLLSSKVALQPFFHLVNQQTSKITSLHNAEDSLSLQRRKDTMETKPGLCVALICLLCLLAHASANNIDTRQPILRSPPSAERQMNAYFGYSLVLHQVAAVSAGQRQQALQNTR